MNITVVHTTVYTVIALLAFAANSILCRMALSDGAIDATSFTLIRLASGAVFLFLILSFGRSRSDNRTRGGWLPATMLFIYAAGFSFGYISLDTGTGALILFGAVQLTMLASSIVLGNKLTKQEWMGVGLAFVGLAYLVAPSVGTPTMQGFLFMSCAGIAWGFYSILGSKSQNPLSDTAFNFLRTMPFCIALAIFTTVDLQLSKQGILLAVASGALASGVGYAIWYHALKSLKHTTASSVQLSVPIIAAIGGALFTNEQITLRLVISSLLVLGGILLVIFKKQRLKSNKD